jgi:hypothetical protein
MGRKPKYKANQVIAATRGSRGIISVIARKLGCEWETADKYIHGKFKTPAIAAIFDDETEMLVDLAESVVHNNLTAAVRQQQATSGSVDDTTARWVLSRKGQKRGYSDKQEISGPDGGAVETNLRIIIPDNGRGRPV